MVINIQSHLTDSIPIKKSESEQFVFIIPENVQTVQQERWFYLPVLLT